jgi:membrane-bound serine protease (ClpP class)
MKCFATLFLWASLAIFPISATTLIIPLDGEISPANAAFFSRSVTHAENSNAEHIILDLNTFGGRVDSALNISSRIQESSIPVTIFIRKQAWSAGALIALSSPEIYMAPGSTIGSATPVDGKSGEVLDEKYVSAVRAHFKALAQENGYNSTMAQGMVDSEFGENGKLLNLTATDAESAKFSKGTVQNITSLLELKGISLKDVQTIELSLVDKFAKVISKSAISGLLLSLGFLLLITEFRAPGGGIAGTIGIACLGMSFGAQFIIEYANLFELGLLLGGVALIAIEILIIPGFGFFGLLGGGLVIVSSYLFFVPFTLPSTAWEVNMSLTSLIIVLSSIAVSMLGSVFIVSNVDRIPGLSALALGDTLSDSRSPTPEQKAQFAIGDRGITLGDLRPIGRARINGKVVQVVSEQGTIPANSSVEVSNLDDFEIVVKLIN